MLVITGPEEAQLAPAADSFVMTSWKNDSVQAQEVRQAFLRLIFVSPIRPAQGVSPPIK